MKPNDSTVAMHIGEIEDALYWAVEDYLPTLPNTVRASVISSLFLKSSYTLVHGMYYNSI